MEAFKIKNKEGKFSTGTMSPKWTSRGKVWGTKGGLKLHLRQFCDSYQSGTDEQGNYQFQRGWWNNIPEDWEVVELSETGMKTYSAKELYPLTTGIKL